MGKVKKALSSLQKGLTNQKRARDGDPGSREAAQPKAIMSGCSKKIYFILSVISVVLPVLAWLLWRPTHPHISPNAFKADWPMEVEEHQKVSLFLPYQVNYHEVLRVREENMKKYSYKYDKRGIDRRSGLSLQEYRDVYDGKWPVIITDVIPQWGAFNWSSEFFLKNYGQERVTMKAVDQGLDEAINQAYPLFQDFLWDSEQDPAPQHSLEKAVSLALPLELFCKNSHKAFPKMWTYVEDELFIPMRPELKKDIGECEYLSEDYFQLFPEEIRPWNAMLLWGTAFSRSSMHMDPYNWTGTNAVIKGRKRWKLLPPEQDHKLYIKKGAHSGFPLNCKKYNSPLDGYEPDLTRYPLYSDVEEIMFDQLPGELLIIPTGWYHQAFNVEETIAISSQVMNRNNYRILLEEILAVGNLPRTRLPADIDSLSPSKQVSTVMSLLDKQVLERGRAVTQDILQQIKSIHSSRHIGLP